MNEKEEGKSLLDHLTSKIKVITELEIILMALDNYRHRRIISHEEKTKIRIFYLKNLRQKKISARVYAAALEAEFESMCKGSDLTDDEKKNTIRKVHEYLKSAEARYMKVNDGR